MSDKIYPLLDWLDMSQAIDWLERLTESSISQHDLISLCAAKQCSAYIKLNGPLDGIDEESWFQSVTGHGIQEVKTPSGLNTCGMMTDSHLVLFGEATWTDDKGVFCRAEIEWGASVVMVNVFPIFKPADIQKLAHKMNGAANQPTTEAVEQLREQLSKAIEAKENAWHLTDKYKAELDVLREAAERERWSFEAAHLRAEQAEKRSGELSDQVGRVGADLDLYKEALAISQGAVADLESGLEHEKSARKYAESLALELRSELEDEHKAHMAERMEWEERFSCACNSDTEAPSRLIGITFPYATKELEAMCAAALKHWANYTPDMRQPTQKKIGIELGELLGLERQANGEPARKAIVLATAIRPNLQADT